MTGEPKKKRLGRGLSALLGDERPAEAPARHPDRVPIEFLRPGRFQPRRRFDDQEMAALVESIEAHGIIQPILVRPDPEQPGRFEIVAGERRWRAAQTARLNEVPITVKTMGDRDALEMALIENLQREGLSPLEEADGYQRLIREFEHSRDALAKSIGKSRSHVANTLRLLDLPEEVKTLVETAKLSAGHARALLGAPDVAALAREVVRRGLNVRQTEALAARAKSKPQKKRGQARGKDGDTVALERDLSELLGLKVSITFAGGGGVLSIHYANLEQLDDVLNRLNLGSRAAHAPATGRAPTTSAAESPPARAAQPQSGIQELPSFLRRR